MASRISGPQPRHPLLVSSQVLELRKQGKPPLKVIRAVTWPSVSAWCTEGWYTGSPVVAAAPCMGGNATRLACSSACNEANHDVQRNLVVTIAKEKSNGQQHNCHGHQRNQLGQERPWSGSETERFFEDALHWLAHSQQQTASMCLACRRRCFLVAVSMAPQWRSATHAQHVVAARGGIRPKACATWVMHTDMMV